MKGDWLDEMLETPAGKLGVAMAWCIGADVARRRLGAIRRWVHRKRLMGAAKAAGRKAEKNSKSVADAVFAGVLSSAVDVGLARG